MATEGSRTGAAPRRAKRGPRKQTTLVTLKPDVAVEEPEVVEAVHVGEVRTETRSSFFSRSSVHRKDITVFLRQLIMLLEAGTPILKSLKTLSRRGERAGIRALVTDITLYVEHGNPLWQAFDRHPRYFDPVFVNLIKASEASGTLVVVLRRLVEFREEREMMTKRVRGALFYPIILVGLAFLVLMLLTKFVVPSFQAVFLQQGIEVPRFTQVFFAIAEFVGNFFWLPLVVLLVLVIIYKVWYVRDPRRRRRADYYKLRIPVIGPIIHDNALVELTRTLSLLLRSGLSMMSALDLTRNGVHNRAVAQSLQPVRDSVERGGNIEEPLRQQPKVIPPVIVDMIATGEETGRVDAVCEQIANTKEQEVRIKVNTIGDALLPIFTIFIGGMIALLFIALFVPILGMISSIESGGI